MSFKNWPKIRRASLWDGYFGVYYQTHVNCVYVIFQCVYNVCAKRILCTWYQWKVFAFFVDTVLSSEMLSKGKIHIFLICTKLNQPISLQLTENKIPSLFKILVFKPCLWSLWRQKYIFLKMCTLRPVRYSGVCLLEYRMIKCKCILNSSWSARD